MAIQIPGAINVPQLDFTPLSRIGDVIAQKRQQDAEAAAIGDALRGEMGAQPASSGVPLNQVGMRPPANIGAGTDASQPRGIRNNNPGNIEDGPFARSVPGYAGTDGRFARFATPDAGLAAMDKLLKSYGDRGLNTPAGIIGRWAPASDGNNVSQYASFVANGADPNAPIDMQNPDARRSMALRMAQFENGKPVAATAPQQPQAAPPTSGLAPDVIDRIQKLYASGPNGRALATALIQKHLAPKYGFQTLPDGTVLRTNVNEGTVSPAYSAPGVDIKQIGEGILGDKQFAKVYKDGRIEPISGEQTAGNTPMGSNGLPLQGPELLTHLEQTQPAVAAAVKSILAGNENAAGRNLQKLLPIASLVEPGFTQQDYQTRLGVERSFKSGPDAAGLKAANQAIAHADYANSLIDKLGNSSVLPGIINPIVQGVKNNSGNEAFQGVRTEYQNTVNALAGELTKVFRGSSGALADIQHWRDQSGVVDSPAAMKANIKSAMKLLNGGIEAYAEKYNNGMRSNKEPIDFLSPKNQATFSRLMGDPSQPAGNTAAPVAPAPAAPAAPTKITTRDAANAAIQQGRDAIAKGAPRDAVIQRLQQMGVPPAGL